MMDRKPPLKGGLKGLTEFSFTAKQKKPKDRRRSENTHFRHEKKHFFIAERGKEREQDGVYKLSSHPPPGAASVASVEPSSASHYDAITVEFVPGGGISRSALTNHSNKLKRKRSNNAVDSFCSKVLTNCCVLGNASWSSGLIRMLFPRTLFFTPESRLF